MSAYEIALWSACLGIFVLYATLMLVFIVHSKVFVALNAVVVIVLYGAFIFVASGLEAALMNVLTKDGQKTWVIVIGVLSNSSATLGLRDYLRSASRDTLVDKGLLLLSWISASMLLTLLLPNQEMALEYMAITLGCTTVASFWLTVRSWLLGDQSARIMVLACVALVFSAIGLYGLMLGALKDSMELQIIVAVGASLHVALVCHAIIRRFTEQRRMLKAMAASQEKDLLTQLWTGVAFIRKVDEAISRAKRNRKELALFYLEIYNTQALRQEFGHHGLEQVIYGIALRIGQTCNVTALVGRYSQTSFVVVLDSVKQAAFLRTLGLRLATSLRRPYLLNMFTSDPREFRADIGVGVTRVSIKKESQNRPVDTTNAASFDSLSIAQEVLHEASEIALHAQTFASRAGIFDDLQRKVVALETAHLD